jgi:hypothetical protein
LAAIDQETADLIVAAESASPLPIDPITEALLAEQELTRQAIADEELNARLDRAADVPLTDEDAAILAQEVADLQIAAESASPVDTDPDGLLAQQEAIRQAQDAADLNTALTYEAAPVPLSALNESEFGEPNVVQNEFDVEANNAVVRGARPLHFAIFTLRDACFVRARRVLASNRLVGTIPDTISQLSKLTKMCVHRTICFELAALRHRALPALVES